MIRKMAAVLGEGCMKTLIRGCLLFLLIGALASAAPGAFVLKIKVPSANLWTKPDLNSTVDGLLKFGLIMESEQKTGSFYAVRVIEGGQGTLSGYLDESAVEVLCTTGGPEAVPLAEALILKVKIPSANVWAEPDPNSRVIGRLSLGQLLEVRQRGYTFFEIIHFTAGGLVVEGYVHRDAVEGVCRGEKPVELLPTSVLTVRADRANVWSEPDINSPILGELRAGDRLEVIRKVRAYYEVRFRAKSGIYTGYVQEAALKESLEEYASRAQRRAATQDRPRGRPIFELGGYTSIMNSYRRGELDAWWENQADEAADQGSAAFFMLEGAAYFPIRTDRLFVGAAASFQIPMPPAIWGSQVSEEVMQEVTIKPGLFSLSLPVRYFPLSSRTFSVTAVPSLLFGWVSGSYFYSDAYIMNEEAFSPRMKIGMGIAAGVEYAFLKNLAVSIRAGIRALAVDLVWASTKEKETTVDLGGGYLIFGLAFRL
jgi:hypothetical protein